MTSSTLNMSNDTFKAIHGNISKLTEVNYPVWKQLIRQVHIVKKVNNIKAGLKLLPPLGSGVTLDALKENWYDQANIAIMLVHRVCWEEPLPLSEDNNNPVDMSERPRVRYNNAATLLGHTEDL